MKTKEQLLYQIALSLLPRIGDITAKKLIAYCGSVEAIFKEKKQALLKVPGIGEQLSEAIVSSDVLQRAEEEIDFIEKNNIETYFFLDENYPLRLKQCDDGPIIFYFKGKADLNPPKIISIVGTRNATEYGKKATQELVAALSSYNVTIISGLAYGIDICAHKAAIENHLPTIAILAHGLDMIYPSIHKQYVEKMYENGGILSDIISKSKIIKENFPKRNRIIAGISDAVIVIEAGATGGALITAEIANSYSREVFAIPGRINDTFSEGCNNLIKTNKAALLTSVEDLFQNLHWSFESRKVQKQTQLFYEANEEEKILIALLKELGELSIDALCIHSKMNISKVSFLLLNLEFNNVIQQLPGKIYRLTNS